MGVLLCHTVFLGWRDLPGRGLAKLLLLLQGRVNSSVAAGGVVLVRWLLCNLAMCPTFHWYVTAHLDGASGMGSI